MGSKSKVTISVHIEHVTDKAYLVDDGATKCWLPKSQVDCGTQEPVPGEDCDLEIPEWLAEENGLDY